TLLAIQPFEPHVVLRLKDRRLVAAGLSAGKIRTLRAIATAASGGLNLTSLDRLSDAEVHAALTAVTGVGPWTGDIFLLFCLGRADAWASGDLALQVAAQQAFGLDARPDKQALVELAERWRPWRGVAARLLWSYYALLKARKKVLPV